VWLLNLKPIEAASRLLSGLSPDPVDCFESFAPVNIALCKYWGKRDRDLNLPVTDSLSISLGECGSRTRVCWLPDASADEVFINGCQVEADTDFYRRVVCHIDLFRFLVPGYLRVETVNDVPTGAGLASSASGFAALTRAVAGLMGVRLEPQVMSLLARLGSGSACRSIYSGFVRWRKGVRADGMDSYAQPLSAHWPTLRVGLLTLTAEAKKTGSRQGMRRTQETSVLYNSWAEQVGQDMEKLERALAVQDFDGLGQVVEHNAMSMHATMLSSWPPLLYWLPDSVKALQRVWELREEGASVYATMDAGPNIKLLFESQTEPLVRDCFPDLQVIEPFA